MLELHTSQILRNPGGSTLPADRRLCPITLVAMPTRVIKIEDNCSHISFPPVPSRHLVLLAFRCRPLHLHEKEVAGIEPSPGAGSCTAEVSALPQLESTRVGFHGFQTSRRWRHVQLAKLMDEEIKNSSGGKCRCLNMVYVVLKKLGWCCLDRSR